MRTGEIAALPCDRLLSKSKSTRARVGGRLAIESCCCFAALAFQAGWKAARGLAAVSRAVPSAGSASSYRTDRAGSACSRLREHRGRHCARPRDLCWALAFISCLGAVTLGYLLAYGSGDAGQGVTRHMWGGIALTIGVLVCLLARPCVESGTVPRVYPALLVCVLLAARGRRTRVAH